MIENCLIILLVNILFFAKSITYSYTSDDVPVSRRPKHKNKLVEAYLVLEGSARSTTQIDHFLTTILHAITSAFIYLGFGANYISFCAALLFSFNPINNQGSVWISGRPYVFTTLGILATLAFPLMCVPFLLLTTYFTLGFIAPLILIFSAVPYTAIAIPVCWLFHYNRFKMCVKHKVDYEMIKEDRTIKPEKFVLAIKTFGFYLIHSIVPIKTTFYHSFLQSAAGSGKKKAYSINDRFFWIGLISLIGIFYFWATTKWSMVSFGLVWFCIGISPFLNFLKCSQEIAERYAYFASAGLMLVLASVLPPVVFWFFLGMYATKLWFYMDAYQNDFYLNEVACLNSPDSWFAWHVKGHIRWNAQSYHEAAILWTMARNISPNEFKVLFNLAACCKISGHKKEGEHWASLASQNIPAGQEEASTKLLNELKGDKIPILL